MPPKKILTPELVVKFKNDCDTHSNSVLAALYDVDLGVIRRWRKELGLPPKRKRKVINGEPVSPKNVIDRIYQSDDIAQYPEVQKLLDEFNALLKDDEIDVDVKHERLSNISLQCLGTYVSHNTSMRTLAENMESMFKLLLYKKKITNESKGDEEIDKARLQQIRANAIAEGFAEVKEYLDVPQRNIFNALMKVATRKRLDEMKAQREAQQVKQIENGVTDAEFTEG